MTKKQYAILLTIIAILLWLKVGLVGAEGINSRIQFYDGEKHIVIDVEPNKVYSFSSNAGFYGNGFRAYPGVRAREYLNDSNCIGDPRKGQSGVSHFIDSKIKCGPIVYGKDWGKEQRERMIREMQRR